MDHIDLKKVIWAGIAINFTSFLVGGGSYFFFQGIFELEPRNIWKWTPHMGFNIPVSWPLLLLMNIILAFVFAYIFAVLYKSIPGIGIQKGLGFGMIAWLIGVVPPMITLYLMTNIAPGALLYFTFQGLFEWAAYGVVMSIIYKQKGEKLSVPK